MLELITWAYYNAGIANLVENLTRRETHPLNLNAESFWEEHVSNIKFYHGTSSVALPSILRRGISPDDKPYERSDAQVLASLGQEHGGSGTYFDMILSEKKVYIGTDLPRCIEYAQAGSEFMGEMLYQANWLLENNKGDFNLLSRIKGRLETYFAMHRPVLLIIDNASSAVRNVIRRDHPQLFDWLVNKESFVNEVKNDPACRKYSEENAAWGVLDQMASTFTDLAIDRLVPTSDFQVIDTDAFQKLVID